MRTPRRLRTYGFRLIDHSKFLLRIRLLVRSMCYITGLLLKLILHRLFNSYVSGHHHQFLCSPRPAPMLMLPRLLLGQLWFQDCGILLHIGHRYTNIGGFMYGSLLEVFFFFLRRGSFATLVLTQKEKIKPQQVIFTEPISKTIDPQNKARRYSPEGDDLWKSCGSIYVCASSLNLAAIVGGMVAICRKFLAFRSH